MILNSNALNIPLKDKTVQTCVTSPPYYGLRDYGVGGQIGLEETPEMYVEKLVQVFREVKRVLKDDGTLWLNMGDSYYNYRPGGTSQVKQSLARHNGAVVDNSGKRNNKYENIKEKDLIGVPWMLAFALRADGWYLRSDIIWSKPNPMPESVTDRPTKAHEYMFLLSKKQRYYYDAEAIKESAINEGRVVRASKSGAKNTQGVSSTNNRATAIGFSQHDTLISGRNRRTVWHVSTKPYSGAHFATFPPKLIEPCILAGSAEGDIVLDPFSGSGTTGQVAIQFRREYVGLELNMEYIELSKKRTTTDVMLPFMVEDE